MFYCIAIKRLKSHHHPSAIDWFFFMILDIGNTVIEEIPLNTRFAAGLFQAVAVRAAGFSIVPMNNLAPAVK